jgi:PEGA domain
MNRFALFLFAGIAGIFLAGCAVLSGNEIHVSESEKQNPDAVKVKYLATIRIAGYVDGRNQTNPRKLGIAEARVIGMSGTDILLDRDAIEVVTDSLRKRLEDTGIQILAKDDTSALFELTGVVKELKYDVKTRDEVSIKIDSTLKEIATGKVIWSGEVEQKDERFAGVSGNTKGDIADYLKQELGVVTGKTTEAINSLLMATRPELFSLTPGTKAIPGVTVFVAPGTQAQAPITPTATPPVLTNALLIVRTEPVHAKIYVDGVYYGVSPVQVRMPAGIYKVEARQKGYRTSSEKVAVRLDNTTELEMELVK